MGVVVGCAIYTLTALVIDWHAALPLLVFEILLACCGGVKALRRCWQTQQRQQSVGRMAILFDPGRGPVGGTHHICAAIGVVMGVCFHLIVALALGATTIQHWAAITGLGCLILGCFVCSSDRQSVRWRPVLCGLFVQFWIGVLSLRTPIGAAAVQWAACQVSALLAHADFGAHFVFGSATASVWAFSVLPVTIFFSSLCAILLHLGVLPIVFNEVGGVLAELLAVSRAEAICAVANVFLGQTEAPLLIRPLLSKLDESQLHCVMTSGFASVAGSTLGAYILSTRGVI